MVYRSRLIGAGLFVDFQRRAKLAFGDVLFLGDGFASAAPWRLLPALQLGGHVDLQADLGMIATACLAGNPCPLSHRDPRPTLSQTLRQHGANVIADVAAAERGRTARAEVKERNPVKSDLEVNVSSKSEKPKGRSRETVAKEKNIPERKLRTSLEIDKKAGATSAMTFAPCWRSV